MANEANGQWKGDWLEKDLELNVNICPSCKHLMWAHSEDGQCQFMYNKVQCGCNNKLHTTIWEDLK